MPNLCRQEVRVDVPEMFDLTCRVVHEVGEDPAQPEEPESRSNLIYFVLEKTNSWRPLLEVGKVLLNTTK